MARATEVSPLRPPGCQHWSTFSALLQSRPDPSFAAASVIVATRRNFEQFWRSTLVNIWSTSRQPEVAGLHPVEQCPVRLAGRAGTRNTVSTSCDRLFFAITRSQFL